MLTLLASGNELEIVGGGLNILSPSSRALLLFGMSGAMPVYGYGLVVDAVQRRRGCTAACSTSPFNMMFMRQMGPATAEIIGPSRTVIIYVVSGVAGFFLSSTAGFLLGWVPIPFLRGGYYTMGASARCSACSARSCTTGGPAAAVSFEQQATQYAVQAAVFGLIMPGIDNYAHAGGFLGGYLVSSFLNPMTRERGDHLIIAVGCLLVSFLAIAYSIVHGLGILR